MSSPLSVARSWTMRSRRSWTRWSRTRRLARTVRRLRRLEARQQRELDLQLEMLALLERLQHPMLLVPSGSLTPTSEQTPLPSEPLLVEPPLPMPPPLTEAEMAELRDLPMPDPVEEIVAALGPWTTPRSQPTSED